MQLFGPREGSRRVGFVCLCFNNKSFQHISTKMLVKWQMEKWTNGKWRKKAKKVLANGEQGKGKKVMSKINKSPTKGLGDLKKERRK